MNRVFRGWRCPIFEVTDRGQLLRCDLSPGRPRTLQQLDYLSGGTSSCRLTGGVRVAKHDTMLKNMLAALLAAAPLIVSATDVTHSFKKIQLTDKFWAEGANFGDFNHDG